MPELIHLDSTVTALTKTTAYTIEIDEFITFLDKNPTLLETFCNSSFIE